MTKPPPSPPLIIYFQYFGGHKWFVRFDLIDWESKWEQAHWMKCENVWWLTCPVAIILFTLTAFNQFCRTLHLVINGDRHTNCFPSVENNRRLHLRLHLLYCSLRMHPIFCVKRLSWIGEPQPFQAKEGYVEYQRVNWRPNVHPMIRHILFVTYCIFISWGTNEKRGWNMIEDLLWDLATSFQTSLEAFSHTFAQRLLIKNVKGRADIRPSMRRCFLETSEGRCTPAVCSSSQRIRSYYLGDYLSKQSTLLQNLYLKWIYKHSGCEKNSF